MIELLDGSGQTLLASPLICGTKRSIPETAWRSAWHRLVGSIDATARDAAVAIRFTHTHPNDLFGFPRFLSPGDVATGRAMRGELDTSGLRHLHLEMSAVTRSAATVREILEQPTLMAKLRGLFAGARTTATTIVYPGAIF